jgi:alkylated DNA repair dioxygenase AlkB
MQDAHDHADLKQIDVATPLADALASHDAAALEQQFWQENEFLFVDEFLPRSWIESTIAARARELRPQLHRNKVRNFKKGGSISYFQLEHLAPEIVELYRDEKLREFFSGLVGTELELCPDRDPHACALYYYTEPGDHIGYHYDTSWYKGARYTVLLGLVQDTSHSKLLCQLHKDDEERETRELSVDTHPGSLVIFNGDKLWHAVSPLGEDEERIILTLEYVTDGRMNPAKRWISNIKDAIAYFGFKGIKRRRRPAGA